jgi:patatin-related protein
LKEKELRLSLVYYGGVSLAVYMHGVAEEILKLTRASKVFHQQNLEYSQSLDTFDSKNSNPLYETDTEKLYFELLQNFSKKIKLRVIVDTISGSSAGGINGIFLARAIAHDLSLTPQRNMWIELADVLKLMDDKTIASPWSKFYLYPFLLFLGWKRFQKYFPSPEIKRKVSIFLRSRWLKPPFSGEIMLGWMLDAAHAQGNTENDKTTSSLMPPGHRLELMVSLTNFYGKQQIIPLNNPQEISEREHRTTLTFKYFCHDKGIIESDFTDRNIPGLAFAARATSSFPGAFPSASLSDVMEILEKRQETWPEKLIFMARNIRQFPNQGTNPEDVRFIDGSVVNNKPFGEVIAALSERPAHREVDRLIVYIDPSPDRLAIKENPKPPGFFQTIFDAVVKIPGNEPIRDELHQLNIHNRRARRIQSVVKGVKADIEPFFENLVTLETIQHLSTALIVSWRENVNSKAFTQAGYAYSGYLYLKLYYLLDSVSMHLSQNLIKYDKRTDPAIRQSILNWAYKNNIWVDEKESMRNRDRIAIVTVLRGLDVDFRIRRLRFTIQAINSLYQKFDASTDPHGDIKHLNALKKLAYQFIDHFKSCWSSPSPVNDLSTFTSEQDVSSVVNTLIENWNLEEKDFDFDEAFCRLINNMRDEELKLDITRSYLGFPFYDVLTLPLLQTTDLTELDTIKVNRISPDDSCSIPWPKDESMLQGTIFGKFGAFFQQSARENDRIWGRLHASERLIDFIIESGGKNNLPDDFNITKFKKRVFQTILDAEEGQIKAGRKDFDRIKEFVEKIG